jgi:hypothetical protein
VSVALLAPYAGDVKVLSQVATREAAARLLPFAAPDAIALGSEASQYLDNPTGKEGGRHRGRERAKVDCSDALVQ